MVFQDFQSDRALAGDDINIVVRTDQDQPAFLCECFRPRPRFAESVPREHHFRAKRFGIPDFHERCGLGHDDDRRHAQPPGVVSDRLRVIAGGHRDYAARPHKIGQRREFGERAPFLERPGQLHGLIFQVNICAGNR